jgi:hypothetical protein
LPRLSTTATATTTVETTVTVKLSPKVRAMIKARCEEDAGLSKQVKDLEARRSRLKGEVEQLIVDEGEGAKLMDGIDIDGHRVKMVCGTSTKIDENALLKLITPKQLAKVKVTTDKRPYIKLSPPSEKGGDE